MTAGGEGMCNEDKQNKQGTWDSEIKSMFSCMDIRKLLAKQNRQVQKGTDSCGMTSFPQISSEAVRAGVSRPVKTGSDEV
jgi:hypothetical protein